MISIIEKRSVPETLNIAYQDNGQVSIGPFVFLKENFFELIRYVWQGGYPRWKEEVRPDYVMKMKQVVENSSHPFFNGVFS